MKNKIISIITILFILISSNQIYADDGCINIMEWNFVMLTGRSDQDDKVIVSKYYKKDDHSKYAFCIEPDQEFMPIDTEYRIKINDNQRIYEIVKAYDSIGLNDDNYFIAAQLLIWQEINGIVYTFDGNDYSDYKNEIMDIVEPKKPLLKANLSSNNILEAYVGQENLILEDYSEYNVEADGINIISNDKNGLKYIVENEEPLIKTFSFTPKDSDENHEIIFESVDSQDIYHFDDEYSNLKPFSLNLKTLIQPKTININYSKVDEYGNPISGAQFYVYELDPEESDEEIVFIQNNVPIDLYEALLDDYVNFDDLSVKISERFGQYLDGNTILTKEIGYFPYEIYDNDKLVKSGRVYVTNNVSDSDGTYKKHAVRRIFSGYSDDLQVNSITDINKGKSYYLCESEPKKGYIYSSEPCVLVNSSEYQGEVYKFINSTRRYTLRLMKESPEEILLDGAKFRITYQDDGEEKNIEFITGGLAIARRNSYDYLIYKHENEDEAKIIAFEDEIFADNYAKEGKYYYYQSNEPIINNDLLYGNYTTVIKGGFSIENLPYSSSITVEELQAPEGYMITEPKYVIDPNIPYSDITFKNHRVNYLDILPAKKFKIPKTCVN